MIQLPFTDREEAGRLLAAALGMMNLPANVIVLALPRGEFPVGLQVAVPVGSVQACERLKPEADDCVCLATPEPFMAVGQWYADFPQVNDSEVQRFLEAGRLPGKGKELLAR